MIVDFELIQKNITEEMTILENWKFSQCKRKNNKVPYEVFLAIDERIKVLREEYGKICLWILISNKNN